MEAVEPKTGDNLPNTSGQQWPARIHHFYITKISSVIALAILWSFLMIPLWRGLATIVGASLIALTVGYYVAMVFIKRYNGVTLVTKGKLVFLTCGDSDVGIETSRRCVKLGFSVIAGVKDTASEHMQPLKSCGVQIIQLNPADISSIDEATENVKHALVKKGLTLYGIVCNAGATQLGEFEWLDASEFLDAFTTTVQPTLRVCQNLLQHLRGDSERIVICAGLTGRTSIPGTAIDSITNSAMTSFADVLRREMLKFPIHVVLVEPYWVCYRNQHKFNQSDIIRCLSAENLTEKQQLTYGKIYIEAFKAIWSPTQYGMVGSNEEKIAKVIVKALTDCPPLIRYTSGPKIRTLFERFLELMPDFLVDAIMFYRFQPRCNNGGAMSRLIDQSLSIAVSKQMRNTYNETRTDNCVKKAALFKPRQRLASPKHTKTKNIRKVPKQSEETGNFDNIKQQKLLEQSPTELIEKTENQKLSPQRRKNSKDSTKTGCIKQLRTGTKYSKSEKQAQSCLPPSTNNNQLSPICEEEQITEKPKPNSHKNKLLNIDNHRSDSQSESSTTPSYYPSAATHQVFMLSSTFNNDHNEAETKLETQNSSKHSTNTTQLNPTDGKIVEKRHSVLPLDNLNIKKQRTPTTTFCAKEFQGTLPLAESPVLTYEKVLSASRPSKTQLVNRNKDTISENVDENCQDPSSGTKPDDKTNNLTNSTEKPNTDITTRKDESPLNEEQSTDKSSNKQRVPGSDGVQRRQSSILLKAGEFFMSPDFSTKHHAVKRRSSMGVINSFLKKSDDKHHKSSCKHPFVEVVDLKNDCEDCEVTPAASDKTSSIDAKVATLQTTDPTKSKELRASTDLPESQPPEIKHAGVAKSEVPHEEVIQSPLVSESKALVLSNAPENGCSTPPEHDKQKDQKIDSVPESVAFTNRDVETSAAAKTKQNIDLMQNILRERQMQEQRSITKDNDSKAESSQAVDASNQSLSFSSPPDNIFTLKMADIKPHINQTNLSKPTVLSGKRDSDKPYYQPGAMMPLTSLTSTDNQDSSLQMKPKENNSKEGPDEIGNNNDHCNDGGAIIELQSETTIEISDKSAFLDLTRQQLFILQLNEAFEANVENPQSVDVDSRQFFTAMDASALVEMEAINNKSTVVDMNATQPK